MLNVAPTIPNNMLTVPCTRQSRSSRDRRKSSAEQQVVVVVVVALILPLLLLLLLLGEAMGWGRDRDQQPSAGITPLSKL